MAKRSPAKEIDIELMRRRIDYNPETGVATYRQRPVSDFPNEFSAKAWNGHYAGRKVWSKRVTPNGKQYLRLAIWDNIFALHRVVWTLQNGPIPDGLFIDHINGDTLDNRICNLRLVTIRENSRNLSMQSKKESSLPMGIQKYYRRYKASMYADGKTTHLGSFATVEEAVGARKAAEAAMGFHPNHGER